MFITAVTRSTQAVHHIRSKNNLVSLRINHFLQMAASLRYFVFSCCVFLACHQVVTGLQCYSCSSCNSNSNDWTTTSSSASGASCFKYVYSLSIISYVNRGLSTNCTAGSDGLGGYYYCCSTYNCNGGVSLSSSLGLAFALVVTVSVFKAVMIK